MRTKVVCRLKVSSVNLKIHVLNNMLICSILLHSWSEENDGPYISHVRTNILCLRDDVSFCCVNLHINAQVHRHTSAMRKSCQQPVSDLWRAALLWRALLHITNDSLISPASCLFLCCRAELQPAVNGRLLFCRPFYIIVSNFRPGELLIFSFAVAPANRLGCVTQVALCFLLSVTDRWS